LAVALPASLNGFLCVSSLGVRCGWKIWGGLFPSVWDVGRSWWEDPAGGLGRFALAISQMQFFFPHSTAALYMLLDLLVRVLLPRRRPVCDALSCFVAYTIPQALLLHVSLVWLVESTLRTGMSASCVHHNRKAVPGLVALYSAGYPLGGLGVGLTCWRWIMAQSISLCAPRMIVTVLPNQIRNVVQHPTMQMKYIRSRLAHSSDTGCEKALLVTILGFEMFYISFYMLDIGSYKFSKFYLGCI